MAVRSTAFCWSGLLSLLCVLRVGPLSAADAPPAAPAGERIDYAIVVTGEELLWGAYPDAHTCYLTRTLRPLGLHCIGSMTVDDRRADIQQAVRFFAEKAKLVIVTGGLGPTTNDVTREALAECTGIELREHPDVLGELERRFRAGRDELRANIRRQARLPTRGTYLKNANGTAAGLVFEPDGAVVVALPGPPRELQPMVRDELVPYLSRRFGTRSPGCSLTLRFVGLGQSQIEQTLKQHITLPPDVIEFSSFEGTRVDFTFLLPNDTEQDRARLEKLKHEIFTHLGENIYADDQTTLEEHVAKLLSNRSATLTLAEVHSGGSLAAALSGSPSGRRVLAGSFSAPSTQQLARLVRLPEEKFPKHTPSTQQVELLAAAAANLTGSAGAMAVGEAQQEPGGSRYVDVALKLPASRMEHQRVGLRGSGEQARLTLTTQLLDLLRRRLK